jgi:glycosyltransferase involved in cell wall biosynthesis
VIHSGIPALPPPDPAGLPPLPDRFVLAVGAIEPRKDPLLLVAAHGEARRRGLDAGLVFAGDGPLADRVDTRVRPTPAQLAWLYANALALAMPSRLEGFGFPPLEAARAGTPSIVSDLPVFRETLGDGATFVPPGDVDAWAATLVRAGEGGLPVADTSRFSWTRAARELHAVLEEATA